MKKNIIITVLAVALITSLGVGASVAAAPTGSAVLMETYSGTSTDLYTIVSRSYPQVRHVSVTVAAVGPAAPGGRFLVRYYFPEGITPPGFNDWMYLGPLEQDIQVRGTTIEFDAAKWDLRLTDLSGANEVFYSVTETYPR